MHEAHARSRNEDSQVVTLTSNSLQRPRQYCWPSVAARCRSVAACMTGSSWVAANAAVCSGSCASLRTIAVSSAMGRVAEPASSAAQGSLLCSDRALTSGHQAIAGKVLSRPMVIICDACTKQPRKRATQGSKVAGSRAQVHWSQHALAHPLSLEKLAQGDEESQRSVLPGPRLRVVQQGVRKQRRLSRSMPCCWEAVQVSCSSEKR